MTHKILVAAALAFGLGTAVAVAQTSPTQQEGASDMMTTNTQLPTGWDGAIADAFFADPQMGTLHSQSEVQSNWQALDAAQQAQVRTDCATMDTARAQSDDGMTTGSTTPDSATPGETATLSAALDQVCDWVGAM